MRHQTIGFVSTIHSSEQYLIINDTGNLRLGMNNVRHIYLGK